MRTVAVVIAHIYGRRNSLEPVLRAVRGQPGVNADVIEDCAEAFDGRYCGHPDADLSMFSFGGYVVCVGWIPTLAPRPGERGHTSRIATRSQALSK